MAYSYYIYYRVTPNSAETCEARVLELFSTLKQSTNVAGRLLRKRSEPLLWMEVYENVRDDAKFELELEQAAAQLKIAECLQEGSTRAAECFEA
ncbi:MAG TPA: DUF4936 family protein [Burkholderiales bacterium]|jgi:hypothetical protein|nr:DUF4936 family protein [Burkholderiales bacterium]